MREYKSKEELIEEIQKTSELFISEFDNISEDEKAISGTNWVAYMQVFISNMEMEKA